MTQPPDPLDTLLAAHTRPTLRRTWHALTPGQRRALRPSLTLAAHAWRVLKTDTGRRTPGGDPE